jgi:outer membrane protein TolC
VLARTDEQLDDLAAERAALVAALNRWLDRPGDAPLAAVDSLPAPRPPALPWAAPVVEGSRSIAVRRAEITAAKQGVAEARLERWPDFMAGAGVGFRGAKDPVVTLRLGLALPLWSGQKQLPMLRAAERDLDAAELSLRDEQAAARAEAARLEAEWRNAEQQLVRYRQTIVPQTSLALEAARSSYLVGRGDFSTVIEDLDLWLQARVGTAEREADRYIAWAGLEALLGARPTNPGRGE